MIRDVSGHFRNLHHLSVGPGDFSNIHPVDAHLYTVSENAYIEATSENERFIPLVQILEQNESLRMAVRDQITHSLTSLTDLKIGMAPDQSGWLPGLHEIFKLPNITILKITWPFLVNNVPKVEDWGLKKLQVATLSVACGGYEQGIATMNGFLNDIVHLPAMYRATFDVIPQSPLSKPLMVPTGNEIKHVYLRIRPRNPSNGKQIPPQNRNYHQAISHLYTPPVGVNN
ncbi:hypothetical protein BGZ81_002656 [Podila clonocystis]|nr:hypothetical protein BGZ81_002656 [Podila clonocystis]